MAPHLYRLTYFDRWGKGEIIRLLFAYKKIKYEDIRIKLEDWPVHKSKQPFNQIPVLQVDSTVIAQSYAIARFLAREFDLAGKNNLESARCDMLMDGIKDVMKDFTLFRYTTQKDPAIKKAMKCDFLQRIPAFLDNYEKQLIQTQGKFFTGDLVTWADIGFMHFCDVLQKLQPTPLDKHPKLKELCDTVKSQPTIKEYFSKRAETLC